MTAAILVVDDEPDIRLMTRYWLAPVGGDVHEAPDGTTARALTRSLQPAAVVMDYRLRGELGTDVIRELRQDGFDGHIVLFSAHLDGGLLAEARSLDVPAFAKADVDGLRSHLAHVLAG